MSPLYDVTILTLIYNHKAYLPQLFAGMAIQDPAVTVQWYLIDDASPDGSGALVRTLIDTLPPHIHATLLENPQNIGATASGIKILSQPILGRYCMLLEGDDYFKLGFLHKTVQFLDAHPDYAAVHTDIDHYLSDEDRFIFDYWRTIGRNTGHGSSTTIPEGDIFEELLVHNFIQTCAFLTRTPIYLRYLDLKTYAELPFEYHFMDYPLYLNLARTYKIGFIPESLSVYRINLQGMNSNPANRARMHYTTLRMAYDAKYGRYI